MTWQRIHTEIMGRAGVVTIHYPSANVLDYQTIKELGGAMSFS